MEPALPCDTRVRIPNARTPMQKVAATISLRTFFFFSNRGRVGRCVCFKVFHRKNMTVLGTDRSTRHLVNSQCVSSSCHDMEQSASQKVGQTDKFSQMHCGSSAILSCWREKPAKASLVCSNTLILLETGRFKVDIWWSDLHIW